MTKLSDPLGQAFLEFCESQGLSFVDIETGKPVSLTELKYGRSKRYTATPKGKRLEK